MKIVVSVALITFLSLLGFTLFNKPQTPKDSVQTPSLTPQKQEVNIRASFIIITGSITRSFKSEKYHNQSPDVYIESLDPIIVHVTKTGIIWDAFFKTLPMTLTKDCLITGDGEALCSGKNGTLKFYLNDVETPNLLDKEIREGDKTLINFYFFPK